jgi:hypothetical protein
MTNRDLLKEAIADAKAVKETAIANAKLALEETFNPYLRERLAAKLNEMEDDDYMAEEELEEVEEFTKENYLEEDDMMKATMEMEDSEMATEGDMLDLEALLRELDGIEEDETVRMNDAHGNIKPDSDSLNEAEDDDEVAKGEDDDADGVPDDLDDNINIEDMSTEDLEEFIKDVISDMVSAGELEAGHEGEEGKEDEEEEEEDEMMGMMVGDEDDEEEINIEKMVAEIKRAKTKKAAEKEAKKEDKDDEKEEMKKELKEAYDALKHIKSELNEVNLFNAKLLYTNKIFRNKNLSESQKVKVLAAFDKAVSVKEAKLVYETLSEGLKTTKAPVNESLLRGAASKVSGIAPKKPILEVNDQVNRWQLLAGIKKQL